MDKLTLIATAITIMTPLAVVAYKHPASYAKLWPWLWGLLLLALLCGDEWNAAVIWTRVEVVPFVPGTAHDSARAAADALLVPWSLLIGGALAGPVYLGVLRSLPFLGITADHKSASSGGRED